MLQFLKGKTLSRLVPLGPWLNVERPAIGVPTYFNLEFPLVELIHHLFTNCSTIVPPFAPVESGTHLRLCFVSIPNDGLDYVACLQSCAATILAETVKNMDQT